MNLLDAVKNIAEGDLDAEVNIKSNDEVGLLGNSFNAMVYELRSAERQKLKYLDNLEQANNELEQRVAERTAELESAQYQIIQSAHKSGMAEMATGVLHNIGNILNSVNISVEEISRISKNSKIHGLIKANKMLSDNIDNVAEFLTHNTKGKKLPEYYLKIGDLLESESAQIIEESISLNEKITMMKEVIATQQTYAMGSIFTEEFSIIPLIEDSLKVQQVSLHKAGVQVSKNFVDLPTIFTQKSKLMQVITNLIKNAKEATSSNDAHK